MRRPKMPVNWAFWRHILDTEALLSEFMSRGNGRQKKLLAQARRFYKWEKIQKRIEGGAA